MSEVIEIKMHEDIDRASEQLRNPAFGAYINLEGIFYGVERIVGCLLYTSPSPRDRG